MSEVTEFQIPQLKQIIEAALLAAGEPLSHARIAALFDEDKQPALADISKALDELGEDCAERGVELQQVASGYRLQVKQSLNGWVDQPLVDRTPAAIFASDAGNPLIDRLSPTHYAW